MHRAVCQFWDRHRGRVGALGHDNSGRDIHGHKCRARQWRTLLWKWSPATVKARQDTMDWKVFSRARVIDFCRAMLRMPMPSCDVCPSVRHVHVLCQTSNHILKLFSPSGTHTILVFPYFLPNVIAMFWREPPSCGKNVIAIFGQYLAFGSTTAGVSSVVNNFDRGVIYSKRRRLFIAQAVIKKRHASVNLVHGSKHLRYAEENRTEFNCTHW